MSGLGAGRQHFCCICVETLKRELSNAEYERDCKEASLRYELDHVRPRLERENRILRKNLPKSVMRRLVIQKAIEDI